MTLVIIESNEWLLANNELERICSESSRGLRKVLSTYLENWFFWDIALRQWVLPNFYDTDCKLPIVSVLCRGIIFEG